ncbi:MAG: bifunctional oligoribonuclease/PAP phosphatase NrnA [Bacteroidales bacterium]
MGRYIKKTEVKKIEELLSKAQNVLIISHTNPDGDAVGSAMAMYNYLECKAISSCVVLPNDYPDYLSFLDNKRPIIIFSKDKKSTLNAISDADLIIALDFNSLRRVNELERHILDSPATKILIDHHPFPDRAVFDLVVSSTEVSSTCELLYWLFSLLDGNKTDILTIEGVVLERPSWCSLSLDVAESLYVGMMTDTNNFANSVSSDTFLMASYLIDNGVDKEKIQNLVLGGYSESRMRLMGKLLLNKMVILEKYNAGFITLSKEDQENFNYNEGDSEGFVNLPLSIKGISISAMFTEKEDEVRISLRSSDDFSVNQFSRLHFNGGGHERAAGGRLNISFEEVADYFQDALEKSFNRCMGSSERSDY